jgi:acylphosphatase
MRCYIASMRPASSAQRRRVLYTGNVQGVGFRFTVRQIAQSFAVNGFVRNLPSGKVELVAEGTPVELDRFLAEVANSMSDHIRDVATSSELATGEYGSFVIA